MLETMTAEQHRAEHEAMLLCEACRKFNAAFAAQIALSPPDPADGPELLTCDEWAEANRYIYAAQQRHMAEAHPIYHAAILAGAARRKAERQATGV